MDKKENLLKALNGQPHDHIPVSFWQHLLPEDLHGIRCVDSHVEFYRRTDLDFIKIMHDGLTAPVTLRPSGLEELLAYRPGRESNPYNREYLERAAAVNDRLASEVYTYCNIFTPITLLRRVGDNRLRAWIKQDKQAVIDILNRMGEDIAWLSERMVRRAGCLGCFLAFQGAESREAAAVSPEPETAAGYVLFTPEEYEEIAGPSDRMGLEAANEASDCNILHFCGWNQVKNHLQVWKDYPGRVLNWATCVEELTLEDGREYFGGRIVMGGFDNRRGRLLYSAGREAVEAETRKLVDVYRVRYKTDDGLMIGADCSFLTDFETERFNWVTEALKKYEHME